MSIQVSFFPCALAKDITLSFVVIAARYAGRDVFCRHRLRSTWECPGGHIEPGETPRQAALRELYEETGCEAQSLEPVCIYSVRRDGGDATYGMLYRACITQPDIPPQAFEMACARLFDAPPEAWTYPDIQPHLLKRAWSD